MTPLLIGLGVYVAASIVAAMAPSVEVLVIARLFQGIGGSAGMVIGRAMVIDRESGSAAARALNVMMTITGVAPILAPLLGGLLLTWVGWRGLLWTLVIIAIISLLAAALVLRETLPRDIRDAMRTADGGGARSPLSRQYIGGTLSFAFVMGVLMSYISASPFVYQQIIGLTEIGYGIAFGVNAIGMTVLTLFSSRLSYRFSLARISGIGLALSTIGILASMAVAAFTGSHLALMITLFCAVAPLGLVMGNISAIAMSAVAKESTGLASAVLGLLQFALAGAVAGLVGLGGQSSAQPMLMTMLSCAVVSILFWFTAREPQHQPVG